MTFLNVNASLLLLFCLTLVRVKAMPKLISEVDGSSLPEHAVEVLVIVDKEAYTRWLGFQNETLSEEERDEEAVSAINDYVRATIAAANLIWKVSLVMYVVRSSFWKVTTGSWYAWMSGFDGSGGG